jgi:hypothetical protein
LHGNLLGTDLNEKQLSVAARLKLPSDFLQNARTVTESVGMVNKNGFIPD